MVGVGKGAIGALGRPAVGLLECSSKTAHAAALACLGKEASFLNRKKPLYDC